MLVSDSYNNIGSVYFAQQNTREALYNYLESLDLRLALAEVEPLAISYRNIGLIYRNLKEYSRSLENMLKSLYYEEQGKSTSRIAYITNIIGSTYLEDGNNTLALQFYEKSLKMREQLDNKYETANSYENIAIVLGRMGKTKESLQKHRLALEIRTTLHDEISSARSSHYLGVEYAKINELNSALTHFQKAIFIREKFKMLKEVCSSYIEIARVYNMKNMEQMALNYLIKAEEIANRKKMPGLKLLVIDSRIAIYKASNNYMKVSTELEKKIIILDEVVKSKRQKSIAEMKTRFETNEIERKNDLLESEAELQKLQLESSAVKLKYLFVTIIASLLLVGLSVWKLISRIKAGRILNDKNILISNQKHKIEQSFADLKKKQHEIIELERKNSVMATVVTTNHELNQPLMVIQGNVEMVNLLLEDKIDEKTKKYLANIGNAVENMSETLTKLRNLQSTGKVTFKKYADSDQMVDIN